MTSLEHVLNKQVELLKEQIRVADVAYNHLHSAWMEQVRVIKKCRNVLTEFGSINDESRVGWLLQEIDKLPTIEYEEIPKTNPG